MVSSRLKRRKSSFKLTLVYCVVKYLFEIALAIIVSNQHLQTLLLYTKQTRLIDNFSQKIWFDFVDRERKREREKNTWKQQRLISAYIAYELQNFRSSGRRPRALRVSLQLNVIQLYSLRLRIFSAMDTSRSGFVPLTFLPLLFFLCSQPIIPPPS